MLHRFGPEIDMVQDFTGWTWPPSLQHRFENCYVFEIIERLTQITRFSRPKKFCVEVWALNRIFGEISFHDKALKQRVEFYCPRTEMEVFPLKAGENCAVQSIELDIEKI